ncbi:hypothetical protein C1645_811925 [Glomus cerebriforme]|uniref:SAM domain-containing protein n=1 Tax=Glomus cerebriforme TaxID=658196 RepID=A0A397TWC0_9GLOM|nr:hypothetical protein C1645_811925 [Glomus cerebriforme]
MSDVVKDFNTEELINYLERKNLKLDKNDIKILRKEKISGLTFLELTEEKFCIFEKINNDDKAFEHSKKLTSQDIFIVFQKDVSGEDITDGIYYTSGSEYQINLTKSAIKENPELLQNNVKRIMLSELKLLKWYITKLEAENVELKKENTKIFNLRIKLLVSDAEIAELKHRNVKILKANGKYNERRDAENAKLKTRIEKLESENVKFRDRLMKMEYN